MFWVFLGPKEAQNLKLNFGFEKLFEFDYKNASVGLGVGFRELPKGKVLQIDIKCQKEVNNVIKTKICEKIG